MFEGFPYTNFHELNLDWIIKIAKDFLDQYTNIQQTITTGLEDLDAKAQQLEALLDAWYTEHSEDIAQELARALEEAVTAFNAAADAKAAETIASIPDDYTALAAKVTNNSINNTLQLSISSNIATWHFETAINGVYIYLPNNWYIRAGKSKTFDFASAVLPGNHVTSPAGVADCILVPLNNMLVFNIDTLDIELIAFQNSPYDPKYVPLFKVSTIPGYGGSYAGITGGIGRYLFDSWAEYQNSQALNKNISFDNAVFYVRANARVNMYFEPWIDGIYIFLNGDWYIRNIVSNTTAFASVLPENRYTSYKGFENCIKLEAYKALVFDITDNTYKIIDYANFQTEPLINQKYIVIFNTTILPYDGATLVDIVGGVGLGIYMKWLHYDQEIKNQNLYYFDDSGIAKEHPFNNVLIRNNGQDIAVYNGVIFSCNDGDCTVNGTTFAMTNGHPNSVSFGSALHGTFPYLYCADYYSDKIYINQVTESSSILVNTITLEYAQYYSNAIVDEANNIIYALVLTTTHPEDNSDVYFCTYNMNGHRLSSLNLGAFPLIQGMTLFDGKIYVLSGYGTGNDGKLTILDTSGNIIGKNALPFSNVLKNQEPQGISVDPVTHVLYIATRERIIF